MASARFLVATPGGRAAKPRSRPDAGLADVVPTPVIWRLVGDNNRDIGRSAQAYTDARACRAGVILLRRQLEHLQPSVCFDGAGRWSWRLDLAGRPVAVAARSYQRRRESVRSMERFRSLVEVARVPEPIRLPAGAGPAAALGQGRPARPGQPAAGRRPVALPRTGPEPRPGLPARPTPGSRPMPGERPTGRAPAAGTGHIRAAG